MLNNYAETGGGFNSNHGQTSRPAEATPKQHNIGSSWSSYNSQLEGMYYGNEQAMYMGPYDGSSKHANYPQYPHQPIPTPVVKCQEACCQHFQDRYPINPAPLRYQPAQPRYDDSRQYFTDRRAMQPTLSRKKAYQTDSAFPIPDRHYSQFMGRGQFMSDSRQQMQMMRSQYPMYPPYWGSTRGYGPRMNCPPPPYHQSVSQGAQLQAGLKMTDTHYMEPAQKSLGAQRHRTVGSSGGSEIIRPVPEPKRSALDPNLQSWEFGYPGGFVPFGEVNKIQGVGVSQNGSSCKIPSDKQYHPHQMQYSMQANDRNMMNCSNPINDLSYSMNFALPSGDPYIRAGLDDGQSLSEARKSNLQYDSSLGKKRPDLDLRQYLATWEDDEEEGTRLSEPVTLGNGTAPYIVVDCRSLEGETTSKVQERFKTPSQNCSSKSRSNSPNSDCKRADEQARSGDTSERSTLPAEFQNQTSFAPSMPNLLNENDKGVNFWNGTERDGEGISGKSSAFQPLDCSKRDSNLDHNKRDPQMQMEMQTSKVPSTNEPGNMSFDNLVSFYGDTRRTTDGGYDFVEMTERLVNNPDKSSVNSHQIPPAMTRPCDPRLQQSHVGNNPSIYNKVAPRYSASNFQHFKPPMPPDPYYNFKHPMNPNKYFGYDSSQIIDPNYEYHKITSEFDSARLYSNKDTTKDSRRLFHHELDKSVEGSLLDPTRKTQLNDCYQDKNHSEFPNADSGQFISPIIVKKSDLSREKVYPDKSNPIRERMDVINNENQNLPEKTVLITSQNGPPEIFRVPYSPEKESSNKDNVVTLHSGDQTKSNTITVEVPYVQQYSTLVKLSEEISRAENGNGKRKSKVDETNPSNKSTNDETKKPTSFKLKRLPNSKEWAVENKGFDESRKRATSENDTGDSERTSSCDGLEEKDASKASVAASSLNMPSLDDFKEDDNCDTGAENLSKNNITDTTVCASKICSVPADDSSKTNKYSSQLPQMAIVQPMKLNKCDGNQLQSDQTCTLQMKDCKEGQLNKPIGVSNPNQNSFDPEKLISSTSSHLDLMPENEISKHGNFRTHKKIQSFSTRISNCLPSPSEEFLHSQEMGTENQKDSFSPFHVYSDCDMNSQINEFFPLDERNTTSEKMLDNRMPSSPSVEGMFEDINHSNSNHTYQPKACDFPDLTDATINSHNTHFQSFSTIFPDEADRRERLDGSVLQMNDKKCMKNVLEDIDSQELVKANNTLERGKLDDSKKSPPIPPISLKLKLNESKKMWCIANKNQHLGDQTNVCTSEISVESRNLSHLDMDAASELEKDLAHAIDEEKRKSSGNYFAEVQNYSEINQLLSNATAESITSHIVTPENSVLTEGVLTEQNTVECSKAVKHYTEFPENKCQTIAKYCPRNKIFERLNGYQQSKTLVFDQYGTHFPSITEEQSVAKSIAKDIINDLISKIIADKYLIGKNNIAHVAPYCGNPITVNSHMIEDEATMNSEIVTKSENQVLNDSEIEESSILKTTEKFIHIEKEYYQHPSVIKTVPSVSNIITKLRRPARSIFSPMSDHDKEDDELIGNACENEPQQTLSSQEENLEMENVPSVDNPIQGNDFDLDIVNEDQHMDVDVSNGCKIDGDSAVEILGSESTKNESNNTLNKSCGSVEHLQINENHAVDRNSTEIDDALELMGLSNTKSVDTFNKSNLEEVNSLSCLHELSENESGIEEQLASEDDTGHQATQKCEEQNFAKENSRLIGNLEVHKGIGSSESVILDFDNKTYTTTEILETKEASLKSSAQYTNKEEGVHEKQETFYLERHECNNILLTKTNPDEHSENELCKSAHIAAAFEGQNNESDSSNNKVFIETYKSSTDENQVDEVESRLETSVIVRNKTFSNISSVNLNLKNSYDHQEESSRKNYSESVFNIRNIIHEVINNAVSKNLRQDQQSLKKLWGNEFVKTSGSVCSLEKDSSLINTQDNMDYIEDSQDTDVETIAKKKCQVFGKPQDSELNSKRERFFIENKESVMLSKTIPLDLTFQPVTEMEFPKQADYYCVSETVSLKEEQENSFLKMCGPSYFHEFKKRKWQRFCKSFFKKNCPEIGEYLTQAAHGERDCTISNNYSGETHNNKILHTENESKIEGTDCNNDRQSKVSIIHDNFPISHKELIDNSFKQHLCLNQLDRDSDEDSSTNEEENTMHTFPDVQNDNSFRSRSETFDENQVQDLSIPLKDKLHYFNKKEVHSFLRRDSLKLLEREAVLKEIFSPDPEIDHSESKENECPGNYGDQKHETNIRHIDCENNLSNFVYSASMEENSKHILKNDFESTCNFPSTTKEVPNNLHSSQFPHHKEAHVVTNQQIPSNNEEVEYNSAKTSSCQDDCTNDDKTIENGNDFGEKSIEEDSESTYTEKTEKELITIGNRGLSEAESIALSQSGIENTVNQIIPVTSNESSLLCQDKEILLPDHQEISNETEFNGADTNKSNIFCHESNTNDMTSKIIHNEDASAMDLVTGKDVLFSTTQTSDDQDDETLNSSLHLNETSDKEISYDEEREDSSITNCHNDKINSVQDSLRNNQHMTKETFPLQCLVEAALALEHVDSKQMLLNNSNFPGLYSQSDEGFVESPLSDSPSHESQDYSLKSSTADVILGSPSKKKSLTSSDREIFSKFEETNYNLRASTRIVTSSSSNIIPYSKRKYGLKSAKSPSVSSDIKQKKTNTLVTEKIKSKKRKSVFAYPRSKKRRKHVKDKQKTEVLLESISQNSTETPLDAEEFKQINNDFCRENILENHSEGIDSCLSKEMCNINCINDHSHVKSNSKSANTNSLSTEDESKNDFGGPLLIAGENTSSQGNIFCVHVDSEKMDDYVTNLNVGGLGILSENNHSLFKDHNSDNIVSNIPNVSLENGTSLVIIIEDLDENTRKIQFDDNCKSESDVMLGSVRDAECSDVLTTELSINESCICPPDIGMKGPCENESKSKLSFGRSDELLTTNCYEEINENLINDIGNWPFVEEEVAEFENKSELPNQIPEEGRKIELKCSLPWKKIFNISKDIKEKQEKNKKKKNKTSRKTSGLELGPAKVEVRLKAPSAEWKVISDYHENSSPVVKVSRLILQRESDNSSSSYSEKDSEEESELKKQSSECREPRPQVSQSCESYLTNNISKNENWQPIVLLKRSKELDELTSRLQLHSSLSNSQSSSSDEDKIEESSEDSDSDTSNGNDGYRCSQSRESSSSSDLFDSESISHPSINYYKSKFSETNENDRVPYEKYSPSGCNNSLANEKIYSPSNPHFSPGEVYPDSDVNSDSGGDKVLVHCGNTGDDVFIDEETHLKNSGSQASSVESKLAENNDVDQCKRKSNQTEINGPESTGFVSPESNFTEVANDSSAEKTLPNDNLSDINDKSPLKTSDPNSEDEAGNTSVEYKSSVCSTSSNTSNEFNNTLKRPRECFYDQTKKTKRKMPKNFFVRKKVRRNQGEFASNNISQSIESKMLPSETLVPDASENSSSSSPSIAQSKLQSQNHSPSKPNEYDSGSDTSFNCDNSRLHCVYNPEQSSPSRLNESSSPERVEDKSILRNCGRGLKRPGEGHSKADTKRRRKKMKSLSNTCQECVITFKNKVELTRHNAYKHARRRELHHCLLCQRSFSSAARHSLHVQGRSHQHLELTQRHTMHSMHRLLAGRDCPAIPPLTRAELRALQWRPSQPGYTHVYHDTVPLHTVLQQEQNSELSEDTVMSEEKIGDD